MVKYIVRVQSRYVTQTGLGSRRAAVRYDSRDMADAMGCMQTCGPHAREQRDAAWQMARDERRFQIEEITQ